MPRSKAKMKNNLTLIILVIIFLVIPLTVLLALTQQNYLNYAAKKTPQPNRVFITNSIYTGQSFKGLAGADMRCQESADAVGLGGTWKAWLSDMTVPAASRLIHSENPYQRLDGVIIANNWEDLTDGSLLAPLNITETGIVNNDNHVWTNTFPDGSIRQADEQGSCASWTDGVLGASTGDSSRIDGGWTDFGAVGCGAPQPIYCIEQVEPGKTKGPKNDKPKPTKKPRGN